VLKTLPNLQYLNGLQVDREEINNAAGNSQNEEFNQHED